VVELGSPTRQPKVKTVVSRSGADDDIVSAQWPKSHHPLRK
jgi:hypothetical protein